MVVLVQGQETMDLAQLLAIGAALLLSLLILFQLLLAAGLPLGQAAWGGQHRVLPRRLRLGSLAAAAILGFALWVILARASHLAPGPEPLWVRVASWAFAAYLALNTLANLASQSRLERIILTPAAVILALCFIVVSLS